MRIGIYGGTFDPPHIGHINACKAFCEQIQLDKLYVIPAYLPPHKELSSFVSATTRLKMCELAFSDISEKIIVSDLEIKRKGRSYTADTIKSFIDEDDDNEIFLLCGTDMLLTLDTWYKPNYIFSHSNIVHVKRDVELCDMVSEAITRYQKKFGANIIELKIDIIEISSTEIRNAISSGATKLNLLTDEVFDFIKLNRLYV